jgi:hypothetical protein
VSVAAVDQHGLAAAMGELEHASQRALLRLARREVAEEVQADLADGDHARVRGQALDLGAGRLVGLGGIVRVDSDRCPHAPLALGHLDGGP